MSFSPLDLAAISVAVMLLLAPAAAVSGSRTPLMVTICFMLAAIGSLLGAYAGAMAVASGSVGSAVLAVGLPDLPFHMRLDPLSGFFMTVVGLLSFIVSIYSIGYVKAIAKHRPVTRLIAFYALFIAGMFMVILADDALFFLVSWEIMAAASYFLVLFEDERIENRRAAFLYMVVAHVGAIAILLSFGVLAGIATVPAAGLGLAGADPAGFTAFRGYTFDAMRHANVTPGWATAAFLLAFFGFGAKAGIIPLHVWLPEAHPVAPSNVSALMSGVMLKTAIYGILRVTFDLVRVFPWWWGALVLVMGLVSAVIGALFAMMQGDLKRLLAWSSVENVGIILIGTGLAMIYASFNSPVLASLALIAALYHCLNHAMFKGLLFMGAGSVLHATGERDMDRMGGLIHKMRWTAPLFLVGCVSISGLPPFNGFVSEWLTFQAFLLSPAIPNQIIRLLIPMGAALLALTAALAGAAFVKAFGVTFLGHARTPGIGAAHDSSRTMKLAMALAAALCLALGVLPSVVIDWMDSVPQQLTGSSISGSAGAFGWMWLTPVASERASYSGAATFLVILLVTAVVWLLLRVRAGSIRRAAIWDCGFEKLTPRMQYTSASFAMPIRRIFSFAFGVRERVKLVPQAAHRAFPSRIQYAIRISDRFWMWLYRPIVDASFWAARLAGMLQQGRIRSYLIYSFVTIIVLLLFLK
ncbi:MAG: hydrogenase 4 subunit B [Nitrospirae bacterium]|nr:hydrogenase 4 subunit B [Nitrospirota bacterium]